MESKPEVKKEPQTIQHLKNVLEFADEEEQRGYDTFQVFNDWCQKEGVVMPHLRYPVFFGELCGMRYTKDIEHKEGFIYVPYKMLMTVNKALNHPVIGKIIDQNP